MLGWTENDGGIVEKKISKYKPRLFPRIFALVMSLSSSLVCAATKCTKVNQQWLPAAECLHGFQLDFDEPLEETEEKKKLFTPIGSKENR